MTLEAAVFVESHAHAATLYLSGSLRWEDALAAASLCDSLPPQVTALRVDLRAAEVPDEEVGFILVGVVRKWRGERRGRTSIAMPAREARRALVDR